MLLEASGPENIFPQGRSTFDIYLFINFTIIQKI
jgi:hypothetical protein